MEGYYSFDRSHDFVYIDILSVMRNKSFIYTLNMYIITNLVETHINARF